MSLLQRIIVGGACLPMLLPDLWAQTATAVVDHTIGSFTNAVSLSANAAGELFVLDAGKNELLKFSPKGILVSKIGGRGWGDLSFDSPTDVCASFALDVYVADCNNRRLQRFDRKLNFVQSMNIDNIGAAFSGGFTPRASALSSQGELFILETDGRRVVKLNPAGQLEREFGSFDAGAGSLAAPHDIAVTQSGKVVVLDAHRAVEFDTYANFLTAVPFDQALAAQSLSVDDRGMIVTDPRRIVRYSFDGRVEFELSPGSVLGLENNEEFRDACVVGARLYILTPKNVLATKVITR